MEIQEAQRGWLADGCGSCGLRARYLAHDCAPDQKAGAVVKGKDVGGGIDATTAG